jgi:hypothetical protein
MEERKEGRQGGKEEEKKGKWKENIPDFNCL